MIATARRLATEHPEAKLPCPVCAGSVKAANLDKHLAKVHPEVNLETVDAPMPWRGKGALGVFPCSLTVAGDALVLRYALGLLSRELPLSCVVEAGSLWKSQPDATMTSYADDHNVPHTDVRSGRYVRLFDPRSRLAIVVGCRGGVPLSGHWAGWRDGGRRKSVDILVARETMVALEYALAERRVLVPASG